MPLPFTPEFRQRAVELTVAAVIAGVSLAACGTADGAAPSAVILPGWRPVAKVAKPGRQPIFVGADAPAQRNAWALGFDVPLSKPDLSLAVFLLEHWDGTRWRQVRLPASLTRKFSATDPFDVTVQSSSSGLWLFGGDWLRLAGGKWTHGDFPAPGSGWQVDADSGVTPGGKNLWVFGSAYRHFTTTAYAARYDGRSWRITPVPGGRVIAAASAVSARDIWAVEGYRAIDLNPGPVAGAVVVRWNGYRWARVRLPGALARNGILTSVLARTSRDIWIGGAIRGAGGSLTPVMAHWDGRAWQVTRLATASLAGNHVVSSIVADGAGGAWAAGLCVGCRKAAPDLLWHLHGGHWSPVPVNNLGTDAELATLTEVAHTTSVWGVGIVLTRSLPAGLIALYGRAPR